MKVHAHYLISFFCLTLSPFAMAKPFDASEIHLLESAQTLDDGKRADNPVIIRFGKRHSIDEDAEGADVFSVMRRNGKIVDPLIRFGKRSGSIFPADPISFSFSPAMSPSGRFRSIRSNQKTHIDPLIRFGKRGGNKADMMIRFGRDSARPILPDSDTMLRFGRASNGPKPLLMRLGKKSV